MIARLRSVTEIFSGFNPVISSDGRTLLFYDPEQSAIVEARRAQNSSEFERPRPVEELATRAYPTGISKDGLILFMDIHPPQIGEHQSPVHISKRSTPTSKWQKPVPLDFQLKDRFHHVRLIGFAPVTDDASTISGLVFVRKTADAGEEGWPVFLTRAEHNGAYSDMKRIPVPSPTGEVIPSLGLFNPRYNPATQELIFQSLKFRQNEEIAKNRGVDLWVVKNFQTDSQ